MNGRKMRLSPEGTRYLNPFRLGALACLTALLALASPVPAAHALTEIVPIKKLEVKETILLPTVRSERHLLFTKPKTWTLAPDSYVQIEFQHAHELLPNRSWLEIVVNGSVIKHIPLTHENAEGTTMKVPLPIGALKDTNTLVFRVEQHYTDICEDPTDPSLWTQILPTTQLVFNYTPTLPAVNLAQYPYPIIDPLTYSPARIRYLVPEAPDQAEVEAMALVNTNLGQAAQKKEINTSLAYANSPPPPIDHLVMIGTPGDNPAIPKTVSTMGPFAVRGDTWTYQGQELEKDAGMVFYIPDPHAGNRALLVISGNSQAGVLRAAKYLSTPQPNPARAGTFALINSDWKPSARALTVKPRFIEKETRTFAEMEFTDQKVEKINAPPITYKIPVVSDFRKEGSALWLDLDYSYSPDLNDTFSSLEIRMNDISIANVPLMDRQGGRHLKASIPIASGLIRPRNELVAQFHMMPDKYGYCINSYVDKAWGIIHNTSKFRVEGPVGIRLPDLGFLGDIGFPYSRKDNFEDTAIVLPKQPNSTALQTLLGLTTRFGRDTRMDTEPRLIVGLDPDNLPKDKDILLIGEKLIHQESDANGFRNLFLLSWPVPSQNALLKQFMLADKSLNKIQDSGLGLYMEQRITPWQAERVITSFSSPQNLPYIAFSKLFEEDDTWEKFRQGSLKQYSPEAKEFNDADYPRFHIEKELSGIKNPLPSQVPLPLFAGVLMAVFFVLIMLPLWFRKMKSR